MNTHKRIVDEIYNTDERLIPINERMKRNLNK